MVEHAEACVARPHPPLVGLQHGGQSGGVVAHAAARPGHAVQQDCGIAGGQRARDGQALLAPEADQGRLVVGVERIAEGQAARMQAMGPQAGGQRPAQPRLRRDRLERDRRQRAPRQGRQGGATLLLQGRAQQFGAGAGAGHPIGQQPGPPPLEAQHGGLGVGAVVGVDRAGVGAHPLELLLQAAHRRAAAAAVEQGQGRIAGDHGAQVSAAIRTSTSRCRGPSSSTSSSAW